jgi:polysaccharide export outer membrane protein
MFRDVPSTFAPVNDVPVGPGSILGPGDEIHVQMSGQVNQQMRVTVDRSGSIAVPGIGSLHVAGMPYSELNQFLNEQLGKIYRNFTLNANRERCARSRSLSSGRPCDRGPTASAR